MDFPGGSNSKESACNAGDPGSILGREIPWRRKWQPTPVFLPGRFHGLRRLVGYSPWGHKESDVTEWLHFISLHVYIFQENLCAKLLQLCPAFCDPIDCSPLGSSVHGILQARILEWAAMPSSGGPSWCRGWTCVSCVSCIGRWLP